MLSVDGYIKSIKSNLDRQSDLLVENLKKIVTYNFSTDIDLLDFSAFIEPTRFELAIRLFSMDKDANEVFYNGTNNTVFAGSIDVLPEVAYYHLNEIQLNDFFDFYEQNEETLALQEQKAFTDWFRGCWKKAGGSSIDIPSYFVFSDDYKSYDLKNNQWVDDEDKWS
ncbi:hypothetical protein RYX56_17455 [Alkalihalophilus lindianensis]|uniref:Uncharacterized protein n=1 Tax=Alkalihalophilus lindianensis TaxID=1630542 RepID=A0ABU3XFJ3_9BACI|nr:hypothetical protein [Alkalihalophilus lindianensis]MDV2686159.1 hypothetical protein [Alkalihalophilus lindianensis]